MSIKRWSIEDASEYYEDATGDMVTHEDHIASHAYDEAKERELFIAEFKLEGKIYYDENTKQWLPTRDTIKGFQMADRTLGCWIGWSACAKSRAGIQP